MYMTHPFFLLPLPFSLLPMLCHKVYTLRALSFVSFLFRKWSFFIPLGHPVLACPDICPGRDASIYFHHSPPVRNLEVHPPVTLPCWDREQSSWVVLCPTLYRLSNVQKGQTSCGVTHSHVLICFFVCLFVSILTLPSSGPKPCSVWLTKKKNYHYNKNNQFPKKPHIKPNS